jgi:OOP family OmpA-OmpF porin
MKKISLSALAIASVLTAAPISFAHADQTPGWYVGGGAGAVFTPDADIRRNQGNTTATFDPGYSVMGDGGYSWTNGLRLEGEVWHSSADIDKVKGGSTSNGNLNNTDVFANLFYDFKTGTMLTPYVGAGLGYDFYARTDRIGALKGDRASLDGDRMEAVYQAIAGLATQLDHNWSVAADYRFIGAFEDPKFRTTTGSRGRFDNDSHNIVLSVRYSFDQPEPMAAMSAPTPPPAMRPMASRPPIVAPIAQSYMVFFDFNTSVLTDEAKRILASAAQDYKSGEYVKIVVTGHTDTVGKMKYNQKLSERRAAAVKAELAKLGVKADIIKAVGVGKNGLLVPTADGVREAQNRRAEIVFDKK